MLLLSVFLLYSARREPSAIGIRREKLRRGGPPV
jgi:hypothetical protein